MAERLKKEIPLIEAAAVLQREIDQLEEDAVVDFSLTTPPCAIAHWLPEGRTCPIGLSFRALTTDRVET